MKLDLKLTGVCCPSIIINNNEYWMYVTAVYRLISNIDTKFRKDDMFTNIILFKSFNLDDWVPVTTSYKNDVSRKTNIVVGYHNTVSKVECEGISLLPSVYRDNGKFMMIYYFIRNPHVSCKDNYANTRDGNFQLRKADSEDGLLWETVATDIRCQGVNYKLAYTPSIFRHKKKTYLFTTILSAENDVDLKVSVWDISRLNNVKFVSNVLKDNRQMSYYPSAIYNEERNEVIVVYCEGVFRGKRDNYTYFFSSSKDLVNWEPEYKKNGLNIFLNLSLNSYKLLEIPRIYYFAGRYHLFYSAENECNFLEIYRIESDSLDFSGKEIKKVKFKNLKFC